MRLSLFIPPPVAGDPDDVVAFGFEFRWNLINKFRWRLWNQDTERRISIDLLRERFVYRTASENLWSEFIARHDVIGQRWHGHLRHVSLCERRCCEQDSQAE